MKDHSYTPIENFEKKQKKLNLKTNETINQKDFDSLKKDTDWNRVLLYTVIILLLAMIVGFGIDAWRYHAESYKEFRDTILKMDEQNNNLKYQLLEQKIENLQNQINCQKNNPNNQSFFI